MIPFELAEPTSLAAAIKLLDPDDPTIRPIAGGTALMLMMKAGVFNPEKLVSLRKIEAKYSSINADAKRMGRLINDLLDLNRMEAGREELQLERLDVGQAGEMVDRVLELRQRR